MPGLRPVPLLRVRPAAGAALLLDVRPALHVLGAQRGGVRHVRVLRQGPVLPLLQRRRGHVRRQALLVLAAALLRPLGHRVAALPALPLPAVLPPGQRGRGRVPELLRPGRPARVSVLSRWLERLQRKPPVK